MEEGGVRMRVDERAAGASGGGDPVGGGCPYRLQGWVGEAGRCGFRWSRLLLCAFPACFPWWRPRAPAQRGAFPLEAGLLSAPTGWLCGACGGGGGDRLPEWKVR